MATYLESITSGIKKWIALPLAVALGGSGQSSYTDGQLLIGNSTGNTLAKATLTGTASQVVVTNGGGTITLSGPQDLASTSSPTFAGLTTTADCTFGDASADGITFNSAAWTMPNTITWTKTQQVGVGEVIAIFKVSDSTTTFRLLNNTTNIAEFAPAFDSTIAAGVASTAFAFNVTNGTSGTTNPNMLILARYNSGSGNTDVPAACPMLEIRNRATSGFYFTGGYNIQLLGGGTSPALSGTASDVVSFCGFDRVNTRHAAAGNRLFGLQGERGSAIYLGDDAIDFAASTGIISIAGTDVLSMTTTTLTVADAVNFAVGTTTGTKFGTSSSQKIGFLGVTPVAQQTTYTVTGATPSRTLTISGITVTQLANVVASLIADSKAFGFSA